MKIGLFSIGLDTYWDQFDGLLKNLEGYHGEISKKLNGMGADVVDLGMVDNTEKAQFAAKEFKQADVEIIFFSFQPMLYHLPFCLLFKSKSSNRDT